ncbi:MAG: hypothetical protein PQJ61_00955 [Spirochaetales bacterium]|uniref:NADH-quinone oxidoreductase subunit D domain-containing protein n=1 Tax=Candidatus Thalassospirochaeta sargassi TaxID=3119039 RepID=A0AAJ1I9V1_9SPIO|nr:hypothetical protein [Spirochaetales bacterium]
MIKFKLSSLPIFSESEFREKALGLTSSGCRISSFFASAVEGKRKLYLVLSDDEAGTVQVITTQPAAVPGNSGELSFHTLTTENPAFHLFEREIFEQSGIRPEGHPWLKPVRYPDRRPAETDFFRVEGSEIHQVAVGPVHAGIIEPGHFRFQCHGETVYHLETAHGFQHRGIETNLIGGPRPADLCKIEVTAGDSSIAHSTAYCRILEVLSETAPPARAEAIRAIALELERCANHIGDLGALAGDIGYLPTSSYCGRIRGDFLNMSALICGNRFGRGVIQPGGTGFDLSDKIKEQLLARLSAGRDDFISAVSLLWDSPTVLARFESTGTVSQEASEQIGMVGPAARASGCGRDIRQNHPSGIYRTDCPKIAVSDKGDVFSRAWVRWLEVKESIDFIEKLLQGLPSGDVFIDGAQKPAADTLAVSLVEGWRGEVCHTAITGTDGRFSSYKIVDPSFHNWFGLALALRDEQISDFPVCNKSFNLSYCGFDL